MWKHCGPKVIKVICPKSWKPTEVQLDALEYIPGHYIATYPASRGYIFAVCRKCSLCSQGNSYAVWKKQTITKNYVGSSRIQYHEFEVSLSRELWMATFSWGAYSSSSCSCLVVLPFLFCLFVRLFFSFQPGKGILRESARSRCSRSPTASSSLSSRTIPQRVARLFTGNQRARGSLQAKAMTMNERAFWHSSVTVYSTHNVKWPRMMLATMFCFMSCKPFSFKGNYAVMKNTCQLPVYKGYVITGHCFSW